MSIDHNTISCTIVRFLFSEESPINILKSDDIKPVCHIANHWKVQRPADFGYRIISDIELIYIVSGTFLYQSNGEGSSKAVKVELTGGDVLCILPNVRHLLKQIDDGQAGEISCIHCEVMGEGRWAARDYRLNCKPELVTHCGDNRKVGKLFFKIAESFKGQGILRKELIETMLRELWLRLSEYWSGHPEGKISPRLSSMLEYLREHLVEPIGRQDLADEFSLTPQHINSLFKEELGTTPTQFILRERCLLAYNLISNDGLSVKEAAAQTGFNDQFYFSRTFKRILLMRPSKVR